MYRKVRASLLIIWISVCVQFGAASPFAASSDSSIPTGSKCRSSVRRLNQRLLGEFNLKPFIAVTCKNLIHSGATANSEKELRQILQMLQRLSVLHPEQFPHDRMGLRAILVGPFCRKGLRDLSRPPVQGVEDVGTDFGSTPSCTVRSTKFSTTDRIYREADASRSPNPIVCNSF